MCLNMQFTGWPYLPKSFFPFFLWQIIQTNVQSKLFCLKVTQHQSMTMDSGKLQLQSIRGPRTQGSCVLKVFVINTFDQPLIGNSITRFQIRYGVIKEFQHNNFRYFHQIITNFLFYLSGRVAYLLSLDLFIFLDLRSLTYLKHWINTQSTLNQQLKVDRESTNFCRHVIKQQSIHMTLGNTQPTIEQLLIECLLRCRQQG